MSYTTKSTVAQLLDNEGARAVLERHIPGITSNAQFAMARSFPMASVAQFSNGRISKEALEQIDAGLKALG